MCNWDKIRNNKWYRRTGNSTAARWGFPSFFLSLAMFLLAWALSCISIYLSYNGGAIVAPVSWLPNAILVLFIVSGICGVVCLVFGVLLAIRWFIDPLSDTTQSDLKKIKKKLGIEDDDSDDKEQQGNSNKDAGTQ